MYSCTAAGKVRASAGNLRSRVSDCLLAAKPGALELLENGLHVAYIRLHRLSFGQFLARWRMYVGTVVGDYTWESDLEGVLR